MNELRDSQQERFNKNLDELNDDKKDILLKIGKKLISIQSLMNKEKLLVTRNEDEWIQVLVFTIYIFEDDCLNFGFLIFIWRF